MLQPSYGRQGARYDAHDDPATCQTPQDDRSDRAMTDQTSPTPAPDPLPTATTLGPVHLRVTDLDRAVEFWTGTVGLRRLPQIHGDELLGVGDEPLIALRGGAARPVLTRHTGLYHVAIHVPSERELLRVIMRAANRGYAQSPTDHTETMATYFSDPDGIGIEMALETPERGTLVVDGNRAGARAADGTWRGVSEALDVSGMVDRIGDLSPDAIDAPLQPGTRIGHVHVHVADLERADQFYRNVIGFEPHLDLSDVRMMDYTMPGYTVPHVWAINTWQGRGAPPPPDNAAGLDHWTLNVASADTLGAIEGRLAGQIITRHADGSVLFADPSGNRGLVRLAGSLHVDRAGVPAVR